MNPRQFIEVHGARENNLKDVSLIIPKGQITVFTGVSGSGKSSLVFDTIAAEAQRQLNETFTAFVQGFLPHYGQPDVDRVENLNAPIIIDQKRVGGGSRSTAGTYTDIAALLRLLFSRFGQPAVGPAFAFSFNTPQGMCPECEGIGRTAQLDLDKFLDRRQSLNGGAILHPEFKVGQSLDLEDLRRSRASSTTTSRSRSTLPRNCTPSCTARAITRWPSASSIRNTRGWSSASPACTSRKTRPPCRPRSRAVFEPFTTSQTCPLCRAHGSTRRRWRAGSTGATSPNCPTWKSAS